MLENMNLKKLDESMLKRVSGGEYGQARKDNNVNHSKYEVGQYVEIYCFATHLYYTKRALIKDKKFEDGHWEYLVYCSTIEGWFSADEFQD